MPYISTTTNRPIPPDVERRLKAKMGDAIRLLPGKSEDYLMLAFSPDAHLWFAGEDSPAAMLEVTTFGSLTHTACNALTARLTEIIREELAVPPSRIYVKFACTGEWGWQGELF